MVVGVFHPMWLDYFITSSACLFLKFNCVTKNFYLLHLVFILINSIIFLCAHRGRVYMCRIYLSLAIVPRCFEFRSMLSRPFPPPESWIFDLNLRSRRSLLKERCPLIGKFGFQQKLKRREEFFFSSYYPPSPLYNWNGNRTGRTPWKIGLISSVPFPG